MPLREYHLAIVERLMEEAGTEILDEQPSASGSSERLIRKHFLTKILATGKATIQKRCKICSDKEKRASASLTSNMSKRTTKKTIQMEDVSKFKYKEKQKVLCYHGPLIYEAKCIKLDIIDDEPKYYIHYNGWNKKWDEWVPQGRILKYNKKNLKIQKKHEDLYKKFKSQANFKTKPKKSTNESEPVPPQIKEPVSGEPKLTTCLKPRASIFKSSHPSFCVSTPNPVHQSTSVSKEDISDGNQAAKAKNIPDDTFTHKTSSASKVKTVKFSSHIETFTISGTVESLSLPTSASTSASATRTSSRASTSTKPLAAEFALAVNTGNYSLQPKRASALAPACETRKEKGSSGFHQRPRKKAKHLKKSKSRSELGIASDFAIASAVSLPFSSMWDGIPWKDRLTSPQRSRQDYLPKTRHPKMENQARSDATSEGNTTPSIVTDIVAQLAAALRDIINPGQRDSDLPRYDGTYPAANFFQQYDDIAGRAYLTETKRLQKLPAQLSGEPLTFFRQLDLANKSYDQARQILIDLYPSTVEVSFSKFLALKLTPQTTLQGYYKEKTAMGLQLNLPTDIILESLTEGLPTADQRLVRTVSPNTLKDWHDLMARIKGSSVPAPARPTPEPTSSRHDGHITLAREQPNRPYNMPPRFFSTPRLPRHADSSVPSQPPSPCHYCRGNHWNAQCPRRQPSGRNNVFYQETTGRQPRTSLSTARSQPARSTPSSDTTVQTTPRSEEIGDSKLPFGILSLNTLSNFKLKIDLCNFLVFQNEAPLPPTMYHFSLVNDSCNYGKSLENSSKMANLATYQHNPSMHVSDTSRHGLSYMSPSHETISNCDFASPKKHVDMPQNNVFNDCIPNYTTNVCQIPASQSCSNSNIPLSFLDIINRYSHIYSSNKFDVPKLKIPPVKIHTLSDKIIALRPYRASLVDQREIQEQVNQMLKFGIIEPSFSPYASPVTLVTKKDKTKRFCVDFRKLNEIICPDVHPLPLIETVLDKLAHAKIFTNVDISSAFWQVEIEPSSRNLLAFVTLEGQYQFSRLPFGLRNSPQIYECALSQVIQKYELDFIAHYFDDFVIFSNTIEEHAQHIQKLFLVCQEENIKLNYNKCEFFKTQIEFLGYTIKSGTYTPQIKNLDVINAIKVPTNLKTLQSFLGAINVYNKFIPNYAQLRTPLNKLLKKDTTWNWDNQCQTSFEALKESLTSQPILHLFKEGLPCQLYCDASLLGIAGVLKQQYPDGTLYPVQFYSRALRPHEKNYTISELECLAIIECVDKFRVYLTGVKFTIFTDHHALQWLKTLKNPTGRLFRWSLKMSTYEYEIRYIKGSKQHEADLLSRNPFCGFLSAAQIKEKQPLELPYPNATINPEGLHTLTRKGVTKVIVPPSLQHTLINKVHVEYNHPGVSQMTRIISTQYTWRGMTHSIAKYVKSCPTCQLIKRPKGPNYGTLGQLPLVSHPFDTLSIDTIAGFSKYGSSKTYLHVIVDHLSRYAWTFPSKSTSTHTYLQCLKKVMQSNTPKCLLSDRAPAFTSPKFRRFLLRHGIQPLLTTSNNPQANGLCERLNATLTGKLRILHLENPKVSWIKLIKTVTDKYNQTPHTITGFPPSFLMYNIIPTELSSHIDPYPPVEEARKIAIKRTLDRHAKEKMKYDSKHRTPQFEVGDIVLVKAYHHPNSGKLLPYFTGPYTILEIISPNVVRINRANQPLNRDNDTLHVNKLKYYTEEEAETNKVSIKIPPFWSDKPEIWFYQVEARFAISGITQESTKFNYLVSQLEPQIVENLWDIIQDSQNNNKYTTAKNRLVSIFKESEENTLRKLLTGLELGDLKPTQLLRKMRTLKTDKDISEKVLQTLWMDKLPEIIKNILVVSEESLDKLAEMADKIQEMNPRLQVYESKNKDPTFEEMTATIASLKEEIATLNRRSNSPRPRQRSRSGSGKYNPSGKYCYFHYRFGNKCRPDKCTSPCQWKKPSGKLQRVGEAATDPTAQWTNACRKSRLFVTDAKTGMRFLIDSGADVSLIPFKGNGTPTEDIQLYAADGSLIPTYGFQILDVDLGLRSNFKWRFITARVSKGILGADFLKEHNLLIDLKNRQLVDGCTNLKIRGAVTSMSCGISTLDKNSKYYNILSSFPNITIPNLLRPKVQHNVRHFIATKGPPVFARARPLNSMLLKIAKKEFQYMLDNHIIRPSRSPWASPLHMVRKKEGSWRPCGDYRKLNSVTIPDRYPIPKLEDFNHILKKTRCYSKIDLFRAYYQIPINEEDREKTAVITPFGLFEFEVMSFGLCGAPATFQWFINQVLWGLDFVFPYLDDILVALKSEEEHESHLRAVFSRLDQYGLHIDQVKTVLNVNNIEFLGYWITPEGIKPTESKVQAMVDYKKPETVQDLRRFLGMLNFYRRFLKNAAEDQAILNDFLKGSKKNDKRPIPWTEEAEQKFI
ncbi:hypothetical protein LAZ67_X001216, partial [Cordylochernes scorpioides]